MRSPSVLVIFLTVFIDLIGFGIVVPLVPMFSRHFGAHGFVIGIIIASFSAMQFIFSPVWGRISDRIGRRPVLLVSTAGAAMSYVLFAVSSGLTNHAAALWLMVISRAFAGICGGNITVAQAYIADNTPPERRAQSFGLIGIAFGLGFFVGPGITGFLSAHYGLNAPIYLAALMSATSVVATATLLRDRARPAGTDDAGSVRRRMEGLRWRTYALYFARPELRSLLMQFLFFILSFSSFISGFALFAERRFTWDGRPFGPREIGYLFAFVGLLGIILQAGLIGWLVRRFGEARLVVAGFAALAVGYAMLGVVYSVAALVLTSVIAGFGNGVLRPAVTSLITQKAGRHEQGVVLGLTQSLTSIASIVAPFVAGVLIQYRLLTQWAWLAGGMAAVGLVLSRRQGRA